ncbi:hypothetical protein [Afipia felis]
MLFRTLLSLVVMTTISLLCAACNPTESGFIKACESAIKERLSSPSSYSRIDVTQSTEPASLDEMYASEPAVLALYKRNNAKAVRHVAIFTYDASNALGVKIRGAAKCTDDALEGSKPIEIPQLVKIEGKTNIEWLTNRLNRLSR